jgi:hypothetical protein
MRGVHDVDVNVMRGSRELGLAVFKVRVGEDREEVETAVREIIPRCLKTWDGSISWEAYLDVSQG